jgi:hypothetical protein
MMAPPLRRRRLDAGVLREAALRGLGVQQGSPSSEEVERVRGVADSGRAGVA